MVAPVVTPQPDVVEAGRVLATLDDWRAITFVLVFVIVMMVIERGAAAWNMRKEREKMWSVADKFGEAADKLGDTMGELKTELAVLRAVSARVEQTSGQR